MPRPAGLPGTPEDTADLIRFLLSGSGGWPNGQLLMRDGGLGRT